jgi:hypothetical protein
MNRHDFRFDDLRCARTTHPHTVANRSYRYDEVPVTNPIARTPSIKPPIITFLVFGFEALLGARQSHMYSQVIEHD